MYPVNPTYPTMYPSGVAPVYPPGTYPPMQPIYNPPVYPPGVVPPVMPVYPQEQIPRYYPYGPKYI